MDTPTSPGSAGKIASLLPAATEIVAALGLAERLVGVSHECDFPAGVEVHPHLTRDRIGPPPSLGRGSDPDRPLGLSAAIDQRVRALASEVLGVYTVELEALRTTAPDLIVTQDLCDVCAVSLAEVEAAVKQTLGALGPGVEIVSLSPTRLADLWTDIERVAKAAGAERRGTELVGALQARVEAISKRAAAAPTRPSVLTIEWLDPVMVGGTWMPELVELAGGTPLVTRAGEHAPTLDREALRALAPDVCLLKPCGFPLTETRAERELIDDLLADTNWPATRNGRVFIADGNAFFNRPGPRLVESLEILAACIHPAPFEDFARKHADHYEPVAGAGARP